MFKTEHTYQGFFLIKCALDFKTYDFFKKMMIDDTVYFFASEIHMKLCLMSNISYQHSIEAKLGNVNFS